MLEAAAERTVGEERSSRMAPLDDDDARALLERAERVIVARGRKQIEKSAADADLTDLKGPTGNYRAPILLIDGTLLVGFHREALAELL